MEQYFLQKKCRTHNQVCVAVRMTQKTDLESKICCVSCLLKNRDQSDGIQQVDEIIQTIKEMQCMKQEALDQHYSTYLNSLHQYKCQIDQFKKYCEDMADQINTTIQKITKEFNNQLLNLENIQDNEMNKILEMAINLNKTNFSAHIVDQQQQLILDMQNQVNKHLKLLVGVEPHITQLKNMINNIKKFEGKSETIQPQIMLNFKEKQIQPQLNQSIKSINLISSQNYQQNNLFQGQVNYQIQKQQVKSQEIYYCQDINKDNNLLICGGTIIDVYAFTNQEINLIQTLKDHTGPIFSIRFNQKNAFVSGSFDYSVRLWFKQKQYNQWECAYVLNGHFKRIWCVILNSNCNEIISSSGDKQIIVWDNQGNKKQLLLEQKDYVYHLDYNSDESLFVSRGLNNLILWNRNQYNNSWQVFQRIDYLKNGFNICFIGNKLIASQEVEKGEIKIYKLNQQQQLLEYFYTIQLQNLEDSQGPFFNLIYNHIKQILLARCNKYINVINISSDESKYKITQTIEQQNEVTIGTLSKNGEQLILFNGNDYSFKIMGNIQK